MKEMKSLRWSEVEQRRRAKAATLANQLSRIATTKREDERFSSALDEYKASFRAEHRRLLSERDNIQMQEIKEVATSMAVVIRQTEKEVGLMPKQDLLVLVMQEITMRGQTSGLMDWLHRTIDNGIQIGMNNLPLIKLRIFLLGHQTCQTILRACHTAFILYPAAVPMVVVLLPLLL